MILNPLLRMSQLAQGTAEDPADQPDGSRWLASVRFPAFDVFLLPWLVRSIQTISRLVPNSKVGQTATILLSAEPLMAIAFEYFRTTPM